MKYVVTGGAGFIGSCLVRMLNDMGIEDIIVVDNISTTEKWRNLVNKRYIEYINKTEFLTKLEYIDDIKVIIHMGACSSTTEKDFDYLYKNNFEYTKTLWKYCTEKQISFIYASSAATYGDGELGFDDEGEIKNLMPLNGYGYSKQLFDLWAEKQKERPLQYVGLKYFNVYGPNEYFKDSMASVIFHSFNKIKNEEKIKLFKSYNAGYEDGMQLRDFVYVKDICSVIQYMIHNSSISGLFNVGTGKAQSFYELARAVYNALDMPCEIEYIEMPEKLREKYQYFTEAKIEKLKNVGCKCEFADLEKGVYDYVNNYLNRNYLIY